jgi:phosphatidylinositol alpha-1,6-mannosyltransferase
VTHVLLTNDFPPKAGGIQSYLWELWRRLPPESFSVLTTAHRGSRGFDSDQPYRVERAPSPLLLPCEPLARRVRRMVAESGAALVVIDPALPLGLLGPSLGVPYAVVLHGSEVTVPARLPFAKDALARVLSGASLVVSAGSYPEEEARRAVRGGLPSVAVVPPGVDSARFHPLRDEAKRAARRRLGLPEDAQVVLSVSRLVPRKGMDVLIEASARLAGGRPRLTVAIAGKGRDSWRLSRLAARTRAPVRMLGFVPDADLPDLYGAADVFVMLARPRWGGLEQEGFGIVFLEAAASGVPQVAGGSGGAGEAVIDGETGYVLSRPRDAGSAAAALARLLEDGELRRRLGEAARARAVSEFSCDALASRLSAALAGCGG